MVTSKSAKINLKLTILMDANLAEQIFHAKAQRAQRAAAFLKGFLAALRLCVRKSRFASEALHRICD